MFQIQVETDPKVPGSNPARDYDSDRSELEITCRCSNSRAPGDLLLLQYKVIIPRLKYIQINQYITRHFSKANSFGNLALD